MPARWSRPRSSTGARRVRAPDRYRAARSRRHYRRVRARPIAGRGCGPPAFGRSVDLERARRTDPPARWPRHPLYRDPRGAGFRGGGSGVAPRIDRAGSGAVGGADPDLRPRLGDAGDREAWRGSRRRGRRSRSTSQSMRSRRSSTNCCRHTAPTARSRWCGAPRGRISVSSRARSARSQLSCAPRHWNGRR